MARRAKKHAESYIRFLTIFCKKSMTVLENVLIYMYEIGCLVSKLRKNNPVLNLRGKRCKGGGGIYIPKNNTPRKANEGL